MSQEDIYDGMHTPPVNNLGSIRVKDLQRNQIISRMLSDKANLLQFELMNLHQLEVKLTLVERWCDSFEKIQVQLETLDESQFDQNHRSLFEDAYFAVKSVLLERMANLRTTSVQPVAFSSSTSSHPAPAPSPKVHLPQLQLTKFNGNRTEWLDFNNMFCVLVHNNPDLSAISKFQYLRSCLVGSAAKLIQSLEVTHENYERALGLLTARFENKCEIFQSHMQHMFEIQKIKQHSVSVIRDFIDSINADLRALESIASKSQIADGIILHMVVSKLDIDTRAKWEEESITNLVRSSSSSLNLPTWDHLAAFLERRCKTLDIINSGSQSSKYQTPSHNLALKNRLSSSLVVSNQSSTCIICKSSPAHSAYRCPKLLEMTFQNRFATVKHHKLCLNCLGINHISKSCPSTNCCRYCNAAHHSLLHKEELSNLATENPTNSKGTINKSITDINKSCSNESRKPLTLNAVKENSLVILATAIVELCNENGTSMVARALLDSCSQLNFTTKRVAQFLKPTSKKVNIKISALGNTSVSATKESSIIVKSLITGFIAPIDVVVIPCISSQHPQQHIDISDWKIPPNIKLADNQFNSPGPIDLLIGAEFFWELLMVGRIKIDNQPNFIKTKLGWVVSGLADTCKSLKPSPVNKSLTSIATVIKNKKASTSVHCNASQHSAVNSVNAKLPHLPPHIKAQLITSTNVHRKRSDLTAVQFSPQNLSVNIPLTSSNKNTFPVTTITSQNVNNVSAQINSADQKKLLNRTPQSKYKSFIAISDEPLLEKLLEKFWIIDDLPISEKEKLSSEEMMCEKYFYETTERCPQTNKFIVRLPFKANPSTLGKSLETARRRLSYLESKLLRDNSICKDYTKFMKEYADMKHMLPAEFKEVKYFIPHHCVVKPESSTTRLRVVFDASCCTTSGKSLNDVLCVGPTLQDDIFTMLNRFRFHKYVLVADITKMYRQVLVHHDDTQWQGILWRKSIPSSVLAYKLQTLTYGTSSAPYLAVKCLQHLARENAKLYPVGAEVILRDFYVDNLMTGGESEAEVIEIKRQVVDLLLSGGFPLRKFASNSENILFDIPDEYKEESVQLDHMNYIKTLGLKWSPNDDFFSFSYTPQYKGSRITKRSILAHTAAFFDPLGLINPIVVKAKILLQSLWKLKLHWDESVPQDVINEWEQILTQLKCLCTIKIPRFVLVNNFTSIHAFSDASKKAYGACVYVVNKLETGVVSSLLCAKSRVAPAKEISLPRLELCAALLCVRLMQSVRNCFSQQPCNSFCWSDSTITLAWIAGESHGRPTFVANRITKIQQLSKFVQWKHVPSEHNPADLLSRGTTVKGITESDLWFRGPSFLRESESKWPVHPCLSVDSNTELNQTSLVTANCRCSDTMGKDILETHKFVNSFQKLLRVVVYVKHFINTCRSSTRCSGPITSLEMSNALEACCVIIQASHFANELNQLRTGRPLENRKILQLSPFLANGLIRVGGRLKNSPLSFSAKHPILLPKNHPFINTLINYYHRKHFHAGVISLHNILREKFWILNAKNIIKRVIHSCVLCYRYNPKTQQQIMADLPTDRVQVAFPFQICGVDYFGPFSITQKVRGRLPIKGYISLFICFSTKAVHMELVPDLTSTAFIAALRRFISRRGLCSTIYSDNATNFVGANRELRALLDGFISEDHISIVREACMEEGITWKFIPPRSPHFGGLWESGVKQAKHLLRRAIGNSVLTYDELNTVVCQAEAIINSRPLTAISSDPNDLRPLTPAHFLIGRPLTAFPEPNFNNFSTATIKSYKLVQWIRQHFWERWRKEYLNCLQQRTKWAVKQPNLAVNDLVLVKDDNLPPLKWPLARIIDVNTGDDGFVRVATVKTNDGVFKRAITKLCKLPLEQ